MDNQIGLFVTQIYPIIVDVSSKRMVSKDFCIATPQVKGPEGIAKYFSSFIDTVGHNIWWENSRNGSFKRS